MKIIVSQQDLPALPAQAGQAGKKLLIIFKSGKSVDKYRIDKAEEFLLVVDKFLKKSDNAVKAINMAGLGFVNTGVLTERVIKAIIAGLSF